MTPPLLEAEGLSKAFGGVQAVRDVSLRVEPGRLVAMIGPNGAGKSTCFNLLTGQLAPDRGRVRIAGRDTTGLRPRQVWRLGVGRTFQITATFASMTVRENLVVALLSHAGRLRRPVGRARDAERSRSDALLRLAGIEAVADRPCGELAYGDLKRVELALALANDPKLLLMDEPTAGMAPAERAALMRVVAGIARERGLGILFTEHDLDVVFANSDRIVVLHRGRVVAEGPPDEVRRDPEVRAVYLGEGTGLARPPGP